MDKIRNIGIIAHIDAGKTTTTERFLYYTGKTHKIGEVDEGTAVMDWMEQEKERGITISAAATTCLWKGYKINIIDTPGHVDFTAEVERSLRVLDGAIGVFCGVAGVQSQSETVWRQSEKYNVPKLVFVNKLDRVGADFFRVIDEIKIKLNTSPLIMNIPIYDDNEEFIGLIDIIEEKEVIYNETYETEAEVKDIEEKNREKFLYYKKNLIEKVAEVDDYLMGKYVEEEEIKKSEIKRAIRKGTIKNLFCPVFCGSALKNKGTLFLLDGIVNYLPSPVDRGKIEGFSTDKKKKIERHPNENQPFSGLIFKVYNDIHLGRVLYTRIYSGKIKKGEKVYNSSRNVKEKLMRILEVHTNKYYEKEQGKAGEIVALLGPKKTYTGDTICDELSPIIFESVEFPEPVIYLAVEPKTMSQHEDVYNALLKIADEDPTIKIRTDAETGQMIIMGMGELHLDVVIGRLKREDKLEVKVGRPHVAYRETITVPSIGEGKFIKQSGTKGIYGHVVLKLEPLERGKRFIFESKVDSEKIPDEFIPAIEEGIKEGMEVGTLGGFPVIDIKAVVIDGSFHPTDSDEVAYKIASTIAFKDAYRKGYPILLEPIMKVEITVPEEFLGEILDDLNFRKGKIESIETLKDLKIIVARIPLRKIFGYTTTLRSLTQGKGSCIIEPLCYESVNEEILTK
ncbi:MAG TPA: elongation factor G [bacterium]|nr:elongation factor G [bacterium]